jgi:hypothetical protein
MPSDAEDWLRQHGFGVVTECDQEGAYWAHLTRLSDGATVAPRYGRGATPDDAMASARRRYEVEQ